MPREARPVTKGFHDEAAATVRERNAAHVGIEGYRYTA